MNNILQIDTGIDTFEVSIVKLHYSQVQKVRRNLIRRDRTGKTGHSTNKDRLSPSYISYFFAARGFNNIRTYQRADNSSGGISFAINPSTLLKGEFQPAKLYDPTTEQSGFIPLHIMGIFQNIQLEELHDNAITEDRLSVSQIDVTQNLWFDEGTDLEAITRLFRRSNVPNDFKRNKKIPGFCANANIVTIKAYDKIRHLLEKKEIALPPEWEGKILLRLEVSMKREKFINLLQLDRGDSIENMLTAAYLQAGDIISDYLVKLFPAAAPHFRFDYTREMVKKRVGKEDLRNRMLFLLEKTSETDGLDRAIQATMEQYNLQHNQIDRVFEEFDKIGVNPVTLPNKSEISRIPNIRRMMELYNTRAKYRDREVQFFADLDNKMGELRR